MPVSGNIRIQPLKLHTLEWVPTGMGTVYLWSNSNQQDGYYYSLLYKWGIGGTGRLSNVSKHNQEKSELTPGLDELKPPPLPFGANLALSQNS